MNISLGFKAVVHVIDCSGSGPACRLGPTSAYSVTDRAVTCKRCLKIVATREAAADRVTYYAGLADQQDMDYSQAEVASVEQASHADPSVETPDEPCCEHALLYHGASGCDTCRCNTPRHVMPVAGTVWVGRDVETDAGLVPATALLVEAVFLSWIPSILTGVVITATNGEGTYWVFSQHQCTKARMLYVGLDMAEAAKAATAYTVQHTDYVAMLGVMLGGSVIPTQVNRTVYGPIPKPAEPAYETDPRTGLPVL